MSGMTPAEIKAYYSGVRDAVRGLAIWHDGEQHVGVIEKPLEQVLADIQRLEDHALLDRRIYPWPF